MAGTGRPLNSESPQRDRSLKANGIRPTLPEMPAARVASWQECALAGVPLELQPCVEECAEVRLGFARALADEREDLDSRAHVGVEEVERLGKPEVLQVKGLGVFTGFRFG